MNKYFAYVNSRFKLSGTTDAFTYRIDVPQGFNRVALMNINIPKSYYMVQTPYNTFTLKEGGTTYTITITQGNYNRTTFKTELQTQLNAMGSFTYTITTDATNTVDTGHYYFSVSGNSGVQPQFIFPATSSLFENMGFDKESTNAFVGDNLTSANVIKMIREDVIYLHSDILRNIDNNILQEVYTVGNPAYSSIVYSNPDIYGNSKILNTSNSNVYSFWLRNEDDQIIDLQGLNFNFSLVFWYEKNATDKEIIKKIKSIFQQ